MACCAAVGGRLGSEALAALNANLLAGMSLRVASKQHGLPYSAIQQHAAAGHHRVDFPEQESAANQAESQHKSGRPSQPQETTERTSPYMLPPHPGDDPETAPRKLVTLDIERRCVELRVKGTTYADMAAQLGITERTANEAVERVLVRTRKGADAKADLARQLDLARIDKLLESISDLAQAPPDGQESDDGPDYDVQLRAVDRVTKLLERRAKLLGLDAPTGVRLSIVDAARESEDFGEVWRVAIKILDARYPGASALMVAGLDTYQDNGEAGVDAFLAGDMAVVQ